jgi:nanoRNase/pAp phosphatase (c-di-AMP/oligoRNAs hydrolase)
MERLNIDELARILEEIKNERVMLTFHSMGDTDSVSSAYALAMHMPNATVATPDEITANSGRILRKLGFAPDDMSREFQDSASVVILVDANNFGDCGPFGPQLEAYKGRIIIIDHHAKVEIQRENTYVFDDESYNSASSIVYELLKKLGFDIDKNCAMLLLTGIISDSAELKNSDYRTFLQIGELLKAAGSDYNEVQNIMQHLADPYARAKTIGDMAGAHVEIVDGILLAYGGAHAHANIAADLMIKAGADVSLFGTQSETEVSFSARLRPLFDRKLGLHLGVLMRKLAPIINGSGGGHPCAGGAYGNGINGRDEFERAFREEILKSIKNMKNSN